MALPALAAILLAGCSRTPDTTEAVKQGIIKDLQKKVDVNNMDVNVSSVSFRGKEANAMVSFNPKGQPGAGMQMRYTMEKKDDGWHIKDRQGDVAAHGSGIGMQRQQPGEGGQGEMPPGHPPIGDGGKMTPPPTRQ